MDGLAALEHVVCAECEPLPVAPVREALKNRDGSHAGYRVMPAPPCP
jgi:hypothetical protein